VLVQSSSTTTSIIIALVGAGELSVAYAIYMVMGANIGTSVTNTLVSMAHVSDKDELRRGFAAATVHDLFNILTVCVLLPLEWITTAGDGVIQQQGKPGGVLQAMTYEMTVNEEACDPDAEECKKWEGPIKLYVVPYTDEVVAYEKKVADYVSQKYCDGYCDIKSDDMKAQFESLMCPGDTDHCRAAIRRSTGIANEDLDAWFESDGKLKSKRYPKYVYIKPDGTRVYVNDVNRGAVFTDEVTLFDSAGVLDVNFTAGYNTNGRAYGFCSEGWKSAPCEAPLLKTSCKASRDWEMTDEEAGTFAVIFSIVVICTVLYVLVNTLSYLLKGKMAYAVKYALSVNGYFSIAIGCGITILVQSSSITTSTLTPLCAVGLITLAQMYPLTLGANIGTTVTGLLAATVATSNARESLQVALVHLFFNIFGIILWYVPPPARDVPIAGATFLGEKAGEYAWFPMAYTAAVFFIIPAIVYGISVAAEGA
jgi:sodium-dependent phosphate cotransporter